MAAFHTPIGRFGSSARLCHPARRLTAALEPGHVRHTASLARSAGPSRDMQFWSDTCQPMVEVLLRQSGTYSAKEQQEHLRFLREGIVPNLGPRPSRSHECTSLLNRDGSPFRPSWNFSGDGQATLRLGYDPIGPDLGTANDPFGQSFLKASTNAFAEAANPKADMTWYRELMETLYLTPEEEASLHARWPGGTVRPPHHFFAYGCKGMKRDFKPYFHPFLKVQATGKSSGQVIYDGIASVATLRDELSPATSMVRQYTDARADVFVPHMIGVDCVEPAKARLKIYGLSPSNALNLMEDVMTLGGKLTDRETMRGVAIFRALYPLLINEKGHVNPASSKEPRNQTTAHKGTIHSFEMKPGRELPEPKVYLPIWQYAEKEQENVEAMQAIFRSLGWHGTADRYASALREAFPAIGPDSPTGTHAWVSFSYTDAEGSYMTVYLAPRIQEVWRAGAGNHDSREKGGHSWHPAFQKGSEKNQDYPARLS